MPTEVPAAPQPPLTPFISMVLGRCDHCGRKGGSESNVRLERCSSCARTAYCNKDCQKAAWPEHKTYCQQVAAFGPRPLNDDPESVAAFKEAFRRFGLAPDQHQRQLNIKPGHRHWDTLGLSQTRKALRIVLKLNPALAGPSPDLVDPARAFILKEYAVADRSDGSMGWSANLTGGCQAEREREEFEEHARHHTVYEYVGLVPICYMIEDTGFKRWFFIPIYRNPRPRGPTSKATSRAFQSVVKLCVETICAEISLCAVDADDPEIGVAIPGRLVRTCASCT
ncbi:hypothetical protein LXA43DRAFT_1103365 [Ganoderma leucocontextum]|nr:hypothetical protein LXA43DRAFT_1103365 [Ganoderma leucocontextum]